MASARAAEKEGQVAAAAPPLPSQNQNLGVGRRPLTFRHKNIAQTVHKSEQLSRSFQKGITWFKTCRLHLV